MRVLLDENLPVDLAAELLGHEVATVTSLAWVGVKNSELLRRAEGQFEVFVTMDRNLEFQQNISVLDLGVVLIRAPSNRMVHLYPSYRTLWRLYRLCGPVNCTELVPNHGSQPTADGGADERR